MHGLAHSLAPRGAMGYWSGWYVVEWYSNLSHSNAACLVHVMLNVCGSAHHCGCMVNSSVAMVIFESEFLASSLLLLYTH